MRFVIGSFICSETSGEHSKATQTYRHITESQRDYGESLSGEWPSFQRAGKGSDVFASNERERTFDASNAPLQGPLSPRPLLFLLSHNESMRSARLGVFYWQTRCAKPAQPSFLLGSASSQTNVSTLPSAFPQPLSLPIPTTSRTTDSPTMMPPAAAPPSPQQILTGLTSAFAAEGERRDEGGEEGEEEAGPPPPKKEKRAAPATRRDHG